MGNVFNEIFRVSKHQIIWGGNYFNLPQSQGFLFGINYNPKILVYPSASMLGIQNNNLQKCITALF